MDAVRPAEEPTGKRPAAPEMGGYRYIIALARFNYMLAAARICRAGRTQVLIMLHSKPTHNSNAPKNPSREFQFAVGFETSVSRFRNHNAIFSAPL